MRCPICNAFNPKENRFCGKCGEPLRNRDIGGGKRRPNRPDGKAKRRPGKGKAGSGRTRKEGIIAVIVLVAAAVGMLLIINPWQPRTRGGGIGLPDSPGLSVALTDNPAVIKIARQFKCQCGECDLVLTDCTCDDPNGAQEMTGYITGLVGQGMPENDIIAAVQAKYGGKI